MDKVLFVVDMQEIYVGRGRNTEKYRYNTERLIDEINKRIAAYAPDEVFYFKSIAKGIGGLFGALPKSGTHEAKSVEKMKLVGKNFYERSKPDVMQMDEIIDFLRSRHVSEIEFVGCDVNNSIGLSVITATNEYNFNVYYNSLCIVSPTPEKTMKSREKFKKSRVTFNE